jgi:hypothetical protein
MLASEPPSLRQYSANNTAQKTLKNGIILNIKKPLKILGDFPQ